MSFGKRNCTDGSAPENRRGSRPTVDPKAEKKARVKTPEERQREKLLITIGKFACFAFVFAYGYIVYLNANQTEENPLMGVLSGIGQAPSLPGAQPEHSAELAQVINTCLPPLSSKATQNTSTDFWTRIELLASQQKHDVHVAANTDSTRTQGLAAYLKCAMSTDRERLCKPKPRAEIAFELRYYFATVERDYSQALQDRQTVADNENFMAKIKRMRGKREQAVFLRRSKNLARPPGAPDPYIVTTMRQLIAYGYLSKADFGMVFSPKLASSITGVVFGLDACASTL